MNILPHKYTEFRDKKYWDHFFNSLKNTQNEYFEWYGAYQDYKALLDKLIQPTSNIFHVGCGKSTFSQDLLKDAPKLNIVNCDYSENVIAEMNQRTQKMKINMQYKVVDLLKPLQQQYCNKFNVVLDKGTLDAMLPQDSQQNIQKIKNNYFSNIDKCLNKNKQSIIKSKFIIISLLQPFVLRTIVQYFAFQPQKYEIDIYECLIKDSKLQPFLILITLNTENKQNVVKYHQIGKQQIIKLNNIKQVSQLVQKTQQQISYGGRIKQLYAGRRTKFNIYNQNNKKHIRYTLQIIDSQQKQILKQNSCSIFIVPQGKQNSYLFNDDQGIKSLHSQIKTSRLILVKLITGNQFQNLQKVKKQLNSVISQFIQNGCDVSKAPYLTDADQLGHRGYLFQNQQIIIDQVIIQKQSIRRLFLRTNPTVPQCQFKLTYLSQNNNKHLKQINSKIMPTKKNMVIGIDRQQLFDDSSRAIYAGLTSLYGNSKNGWKVLIIGCQFALVKFLHDLHQNVQITVVCGDKKTIKQVVSKYLQLQQSQRLQIIQASPQTYFTQNTEQKFNIIIQCNNEINNDSNPNIVYTSLQYQQKIVQHLQGPGIYVFQYWNYEIMPQLIKTFFPVYGYQSSSKNDNILFCLMHNKKYKQQKLIVHENLINFKPRSKAQYDWEIDNWKDIEIFQPNIRKNGKQLIFNINNMHVQVEQKFQDVYSIGETDKDKKANKKKKKKR